MCSLMNWNRNRVLDIGSFRTGILWAEGAHIFTHKKGRENVVVIRPGMECILQAEMLLLVWFIPSSLHFSNIIITSFFPPAKHCTLMRSPQTEVSFYSGGKILSAITHTKHNLLMGAPLSYATVCKKDEDIIIPKIVDST